MFESTGVKRRIVALLVLVLEVLRLVPGTEQIIALLDAAVGSLGGAALLHAGHQKTLSREKLAGAVSAIYLLIFLSSFFPPLVYLLPYLYKAAALLAAAKLGTTLGQ